METWDSIRSRRQVREFEDRPIDRADLDRILEAARRTPSSRNSQPWDFVVVTEPERLEKLSQVWKGAWHVAGSAATMAIVVEPPVDERARMWANFDLGMVAMTLQLAATDLGIGSGIAAVEDQDLARTVLGLPEGRQCAVLLSLGHPADRPLRPVRNPDRKPFDEVVHRERW